MKKTEGFKGRMFLADLLVILAVYVVAAIFALLGMIPYAGVVFQIIGGIVSFAISLVMPLLLRLHSFNSK